MAAGNHPEPSESSKDSTTDETDTEEAREAQLNRALASVPMDPSEPINLKAIAREHNVSYHTLRRRYRGETQPRKVSNAIQQRLTPAQEQKVVDWAIFLSIQGRPVDRSTLAPKLLEIRPDWGEAKGPSKRWWISFFKRHPEVRLRKASGVPPKRARSFNFTAVNVLFKLIDDVMKKFNTPWRLVFNTDEKGLQTGSRKVDQKKCLVPLEIPNTVRLQSDDLQLVTILECVTADGVALDPAFIFPGQGYCDKWFDIPGFNGSGHICFTTPNGWTRSSVFADWLRACFIPQLNTLRKPEETALLIFDGHSSHESDEVDQLAKENNIQFIRLPSHTTHKLQPLDVGIFGPMQAAWRKQCKDYTFKTLTTMPLAQVAKEYLEARSRVMKKLNIISAWKKSGILSLDPNVFGTSDYGPSQMTSVNAFLPPSYLQAGADFELESDTTSDSSGETLPATPASSGHETDPDFDPADESDWTRSPNPDVEDLVQPVTAGPSYPLPSTPPPPSKPGDTHQQHQPGRTLQKLPALALTPRRTRSHGFLTPVPPKPPKKDRRLTDQRSIEEKYRDALDEIARLCERVNILQQNQAKLQNLLEATQADNTFARQHIANLQVESNAKKNDKQKRTNTNAEWLTSEENRKRRAEEKAELQKKETEEKVEKERKEAEARERQGVRNERAVLGRFAGRVTGSKKKDDLKDIAQALCLDVGGKNQELADRINHHLDATPGLRNDDRFKGLFAARTKKTPDTKKRKSPPPSLSDRDQDEPDKRAVQPPPQRPRLD